MSQEFYVCVWGVHPRKTYVHVGLKKNSHIIQAKSRNKPGVHPDREIKVGTSAQWNITQQSKR